MKFCQYILILSDFLLATFNWDGFRFCFVLFYKTCSTCLFLQVSLWYELVVFTASMEIYGAAVADKLDANRGILKRRYYRQVGSCVWPKILCQHFQNNIIFFFLMNAQENSVGFYLPYKHSVKYFIVLSILLYFIILHWFKHNKLIYSNFIVFFMF